MKYAILVTKNTAIIRDIKISDILNIDIIIPENTYYIGSGNINKKAPKFINWYDNINFINKWETKEEAQLFLDKLLSVANLKYNTKEDPFFKIQKTKGDWKNFYFKVVKL